MAFNNFLEGVATQLINTGLRKVAGNLPGLSQSTGYGGSSTSDQLPLSPKGNVQNYTFWTSMILGIPYLLIKSNSKKYKRNIFI